MKKYIAFIFLSLITVFTASSRETKKALLIANGNYQNIQSLSTPEKEARDLGKALESLGFDVTIIVDATQSQMDNALDNFKNNTEWNCSISFFHYGGHAIQINGDNYLIPVDTKMTDERNVKRGSIELDSVMECMKGDTNIMIIDACRDNPFDTSGTRGFSSKRGLSLVKESNRPKNSVVVMSASEGQTAKDGVFTPILTRHITDKKDFILVLRDVRREVYEKTNGQQEPITSEKLISDLYLAGLPESNSTTTVVTTTDINKKIKTDYVQLGKVEYEKRNYKAAFENFQKAEKEKQKDCYPYLAVMYEKGNGVDKDLQKSFKYYELAAKRNDIPSQIRLAEFYTNGTGTKEDSKKAFAWYKKAADLDSIPAILKTASFFEEGIGTQQNPKSAFEYYQKAADKGDKNGQYHTGRCWYMGIGTKKNLNQSKKYLDLAKDQGLEEAKVYLGHIEYDLCQPYLKKSDYKSYLEGLEKAANYGYPNAQYDYAMVFYDGKYDKNNSYSTAENYLEKASAQDYTEAQYMLGKLYYDGHSYWNGKLSAIPLWEKAAAKNHLKSVIALGVYYEEYNQGYWYSPIYEWDKAVPYFEQALKLGDKSESNYHLGSIYYQGGNNIEQNYDKAFKYLTQAAAAGCTEGYTLLGDCYKEGHGTKINLTQAYRFYEKAASANDPDGLFKAGECLFNGWGTKADYAKSEQNFKLYLNTKNISYDNQSKARNYLGQIILANALEFDKKNTTEEEAKQTFQMVSEACSYGTADAYAYIGYLYYYGYGTEKDTNKAATNFKTAINNNTSEMNVYYLMGLLYYSGNGVTRNPDAAFSNFQIAANAGVTKAYNYMGNCYESGIGCYKSYGKAVEWYRKGVEANDSSAMYNLANIYLISSGISYTEKEVLNLFQKSAKMGNAEAQITLAMAYHYGNTAYAPKDENKSKQYLKMAEENGVYNATYINQYGWDQFEHNFFW